jgi:hypothetical protein
MKTKLPMLLCITKNFPLIKNNSLHIVFLLLFSISYFNSFATHLIGGQISYVQLGSNNYQITLNLYRDCDGVTLPNTAPIRIKNSSGVVIANLSLPRTTIVDRSILCPGQISSCTNPSSPTPGLQEHTYVGNYTFTSGPGEYTIDYEVFARPNGVNNLSSPGSQALYLSTLLTRGLSNSNSSPVFLSAPNGAFCQSQAGSLSLNAFDPDGDSISYSLVDARGAGGSGAAYAIGFSGLNPLATTSGVSINPGTGQLSFTPNAAALPFRAVIAIRADEYRNGVKIGEIFRDFEITIINCSGNLTPVITPIANATVNIGSTFCTPVSVTDANNDLLTVGATSGIIPPASFVLTNSFPGAVDATFCFTPTLADAGNTYAVTINAQDDNCPNVASSAMTFNIIVPLCNISISGTTTSTTCGLPNGSIDALATGGQAPYTFALNGGTSQSSGQFANLTSGNYTITVTDDIGCSTSYSFTVNADPDVTYPVALCKNYNLELSGGSGNITYSDIDNGSSDNCGIASMSVMPNTFSCTNSGNNTVTLTVTDYAGLSTTCTAIVDVRIQPACSITVTPANNVYTGGVPTTIYLGYGPQSATLNANAMEGSGFTYSWSPATYLSASNIQNPVFTPTVAGNYTYEVTVTNNNGCSTTCTVDFCVFNVMAPTKNNIKKVYLCHIPPGNPGNPQLLSISFSAVPSHIGLHAGDHLGLCSNICGSTARFGDPENKNVLELPENGFNYQVNPNPSGSSFCLQMASETEHDARLQVFDITGRLLLINESVEMFSKYCFGQDLIPGIYMIRISKGETSYLEKIVKTAN